MEKMDINEYKHYLSSMLKDFDAICRKNCINYSIAYGTMLGAVRHQGFIPWDDDIDVMMTRDNYDKLINCFYENEKYYILTNKSDKYNLLFSKFVSKETKIISKYVDRYNDEMGLYIDIFPMDYLTEPLSEGIKKLKRNKIYVALLVAAQWKKFYINKNVSVMRQFIRFPFFVLSRFVDSKKIIHKIEKSIEKGKTNYYTSYANISSLEVHKTHLFDTYEDIIFEGFYVMSIVKRDLYLKEIYGEYMELPSVKKRISPHSFDAYILTK